MRVSSSAAPTATPTWIGGIRSPPRSPTSAARTLFSRISLRGLSLAETEEYLRQAANVEPARELVARIYEETEGNPFFLSEVVNLMTEEGSFAKDSVSDIAVPEGVRQALGRRLDRLSEEANELLTVLAVAGRDFEHALVQALSGHDDATTLRLLEEALRARVLEEVGAGAYRFTHALMQETLLGELSAARRCCCMGRSRRRWSGCTGMMRDDMRRSLPVHYRRSPARSIATHARAAARYSRLAAEQAAASTLRLRGGSGALRGAACGLQSEAADSLDVDARLCCINDLEPALVSSGRSRRVATRNSIVHRRCIASAAIGEGLHACCDVDALRQRDLETAAVDETHSRGLRSAGANAGASG